MRGGDILAISRLPCLAPRTDSPCVRVVADFIDRRVRLKVNEAKSAVARPETRHFLGYRLAPTPDGPPEILLSETGQLPASPDP